VHAGYYTQRYFPTITFGGMVPPARTGEAVEALRAEIGEMLAADYYDAGGIELAKDRLRRNRLYTEETSSDLAIESIPFWWIQGNGLDYYETYLDSLAQVETGDITDFLDRWVRDRPSAVFVMAPGAETGGV
jgi:predicted Zn-dependent peptidase